MSEWIKPGEVVAETREIASVNTYRIGERGPDPMINYELAEEICYRIASGESYSSISKDEGMPARWTLYRWIRKYEWFEKMYRQARTDQVDTLVDQIVDIADDATNDYVEKIIQQGPREGQSVMVLNDEHVRRSQIRIAARQWIAERLNPRRYGPKAEMAITDPTSGNANKPKTITVIAATKEDAQVIEGEILEPDDEDR